MTGKSSLFLLLISAGCASNPSPEELAAWEYNRDSAWIEAYEEFQQLKRECAARGGAMVLDRNTSPRIPLSTTEMRLATCTIPH